MSVRELGKPNRGGRLGMQSHGGRSAKHSHGGRSGKHSHGGRSGHGHVAPEDQLEALTDVCVPHVHHGVASGKCREKKHCTFNCGVHNQMPDDVTESQTTDSPGFTSMRWAYPDGSGTNCHACERIWHTELSHIHLEGREEYKKQCMSSLDLLNKHRDRRRAYIARKGKGKSWTGSRKADGVRKTKLTTTAKDELTLIQPDDFFYILKDYVTMSQPSATLARTRTEKRVTKLST